MGLSDIADMLELTPQQRQKAQEIFGEEEEAPQGKKAKRAAKKASKELKGTRLAAAVTFKNGAVQFRTPKRRFMDTTAGKALVVGAVAAGIVVLLVGAYYVLKSTGALEFLGFEPPVDMTPAID